MEGHRILIFYTVCFAEEFWGEKNKLKKKEGTMKKTIKILLAAMAVFLLSAGIAAAQQTQVLLPGATIPQFVEPLPLLEFEFINATSGPLPGVLGGFTTWFADGGIANGGVTPSTPFPVNAEEFRAQILPSAADVAPAWPPATCGADTASSTWGYISDPARLAGVIRPTYLGPVVIAETGVAVNPIYGNNLPTAGVVQANLPIDQTLDWADPLGTSGPVGCLPDSKSTNRPRRIHQPVVRHCSLRGTDSHCHPSARRRSGTGL